MSESLLSTRQGGMRFIAGLSLGVALLGCDAAGPGVDTPRSATAEAPDATLIVHQVEPSEPTAEGLAYVRAVADVLRRAEEAEGDARVSILRRGLSLPVPGGLAEAEILRMELAATLGETLVQRPQGARVAYDLLAPMLPVQRSLPMDRATARALIALGDAAVELQRDAVAAGSYARAIHMMSMLREELESGLQR